MTSLDLADSGCILQIELIYSIRIVRRIVRQWRKPADWFATPRALIDNLYSDGMIVNFRRQSNFTFGRTCFL
jgi:hypothetical protein